MEGERKEFSFSPPLFLPFPAQKNEPARRLDVSTSLELSMDTYCAKNYQNYGIKLLKTKSGSEMLE